MPYPTPEEWRIARECEKEVIASEKPLRDARKKRLRKEKRDADLRK